MTAGEKVPTPWTGNLAEVAYGHKVELIDGNGTRIAIIHYSNYDYDNHGALCDERARAIVEACNNYHALQQRAAGLEARNKALTWSLEQVRISVGHGDAKEIARAALATGEAP